MSLNIEFNDLRDTTTFFSGNFDVASVFVTVCCTIAVYNGFELLVLIFTTFRRFQGLYFWSLLIASFGLLPYTLGFMIMFFTFINSLAGLVFTCIGWPMMVTGQSFVLYSRLHVVLGQAHRKLLKAVKWMIIIDGIAFHVSTEVVLFGAYYGPQNYGFAPAYRYIEKIQMTGFTVQELILSALYVWKTLDIIRSTTNAITAGTASDRKKRTRKIMWQLFSINVVIVFMDIAVLVIEYRDLHIFQQALKVVVYSIKLKLEFAILGKLVSLTTRGGSSNGTVFDGAFQDYGGSPAPGSDRGGLERGRSNNTMNDPKPLANQRHAQTDPGKGEVAYIERISGPPEDTILGDIPVSRYEAYPTAIPSVTNDEHRRRRTADEDLYASALRGLSG